MATVYAQFASWTGLLALQSQVALQARNKHSQRVNLSYNYIYLGRDLFQERKADNCNNNNKYWPSGVSFYSMREKRWQIKNTSQVTIEA
jgi:hypothetical protein